MRAALMGLAVALAAVSGPAGAQDASLIGEARAAGKIGERFDGYLGAVTPPSPALRSQVAAINIKRRSLYSNLATRRGVAAQDVGVTAACTLLARVGVGEAFLLGDGKWRQRAPGETPPRPDYCG